MKGEEKEHSLPFNFLFGPGNLSVEAEVDLLSYCAREWKGETPRAKLMRKVCLLIEVTGDVQFSVKIRKHSILHYRIQRSSTTKWDVKNGYDF